MSILSQYPMIFDIMVVISMSIYGRSVSGVPQLTSIYLAGSVVWLYTEPAYGKLIHQN